MVADTKFISLDGNVTVNSTVNGAYPFLISSAGTTTLNGAIGNLDPAASVTISSGVVTLFNGGSINTIGAQTFNGAWVLGADSTFTATNNNVIFNGTIDQDTSVRALTINSGFGDISLNAAVGTGVNGALGVIQLNSTGVTTLGDVINAASLTTNNGGSTVISSSTLTTSGAQIYNDAVVLGHNAVLNASSVSFNNTVDRNAVAADNLTVNTGAGDITFNGNVGAGVNGAVGALILNSTGNTIFNGTVQAASVTTDVGGTTLLNGGSVLTSGAQTYHDAISLVLTRFSAQRPSPQIQRLIATMDLTSASPSTLTTVRLH